MRAERPTDVACFLKAFENHARRLVTDDKDGRIADINARVAEQIFAPWEHNQEKPQEDRQTTFLRDYFNSYWEVVLACEHLETIRDMIQATVSTLPREQQPKVITYWSEAYLNEIYIFQLRLFDFLTATERKYKKDPDFSAPTQEICAGLREQVQKALDPLIKIRGTHVHSGRSRHFDPQLVRLSHLELLVTGLGMGELSSELDEATIEAKDWLQNQTDYFTELAWTLLDSTSHVLAAGIITDNGWLIVRTNYKA